jgi:hypothetical protein
MKLMHRRNRLETGIFMLVSLWIQSAFCLAHEAAFYSPKAKPDIVEKRICQEETIMIF